MEINSGGKTCSLKPEFAIKGIRYSETRLYTLGSTPIRSSKHTEYPVQITVRTWGKMLVEIAGYRVHE